MTRIERIQPSLHKKDRVLVYLTGGDLLRITPEELLRFDLRPGMDLAEDVLEELNRAAARSLTRQQAAEMAGRRMLSQKELSDRLVKKGTDPQEAQETARWLADLGAVDDAAYAGVIVRHYAAMGYGPGRVRQELQRRGIPQELWDDALALLPEGCVRVLVTAGLATIKERFAARMHGNLPAPVAAMLERKYGQFETETHDLRVDTDAVSAEEAANEIRLLLNRGERDAQN